MGKNADILKRKIQQIEKLSRDYPGTSEFRKVAEDALINFIKRVKRGIDYEGAQLKPLDPKYIKTRTEFSANLDSSTRPNKSNATSTGQMLKSLVIKMLPRGFELLFSNTGRPDSLTTFRKFKKLSGKAKKSLGIKDIKKNSEKKSSLEGTGFFNIASYKGIDKKTNLAGRLKPREISNAEVADHYNQRRNLLGFSEPEIERIVRAIKRDLRLMLDKLNGKA
jgi:hypothetical protein